LGNRLLDVIGPSRDEQVKAAQDLRDRVGEFLRQGVEDIRTAAGFIFRDDEKHLFRYPSLGGLRKRRRTDTQGEVEETVDTSASAPENAQSVSDTPVPAV
jgi:hypothetical protein